MKTFICSVCVAKQIGNSTTVEHTPFNLEAENKDEAFGKGMRIALKCYPKSDGWRNHSVKINSNLSIIQPEEACLIKGKD